ncbi:MAG: hypothetical protein AAF496_01020 [Pseudomonadota bacterium]
MKYSVALGIFALSLAFLSAPAMASCYFGIDGATGTETIICETDGGLTSWGTMIAQA